MFEFDRDYELGNSLAALSPLRLAHIDLLLPAANNEAIWTHFLENGYGKENFTTYIKSALSKREAGLSYPFVIKDLRTHTYAGVTRIYAVDNTLKNVKIGHTWIGESFQGTGLNKTCKYLLFEFLFDTLKMQRIGLGASSENTKSIQAMKGVGCKQEGVLRSFMPGIEGKERVDIVLMSILYEEWDKEVREQLAKNIQEYLKST